MKKWDSYDEENTREMERMMIIVYTDRCLKCTERTQWNKLRRLATSKGIPLEERRVTQNDIWKSEADRFDIDLPFIVNGKQAISFSEPLSKLEES